MPIHIFYSITGKFKEDLPFQEKQASQGKGKGNTSYWKTNTGSGKTISFLPKSRSPKVQQWLWALADDAEACWWGKCLFWRADWWTWTGKFWISYNVLLIWPKVPCPFDMCFTKCPTQFTTSFWLPPHHFFEGGFPPLSKSLCLSVCLYHVV